jgi:hypothetical protein
MRLCEEHRLGGCGVRDDECVGCHIARLQHTIHSIQDVLGYAAEGEVLVEAVRFAIATRCSPPAPRPA